MKAFFIGLVRSRWLSGRIGVHDLLKIKKLCICRALRGLVRIRTGVDGFADRCLTARPRDRIVEAKIVIFLIILPSSCLNNNRYVIYISVDRRTNFSDFHT